MIPQSRLRTLGIALADPKLRCVFLLIALLPSAWSSIELHRTTFRHSPDERPSSAESFYSIELLVRPSAGDGERRLITWYAQQAGTAVHYRPEDMPRGIAEGLRARWHVPVEGRWRRFDAYRGEVFVAEGRGLAEKLRPSVDRFTFRLKSPGPALVGLNQNHHEDWRVISPAGAKVEAFEGLLAVRFGRAHDGPVVLAFESRWMRRGAWISLGALLLLLQLVHVARKTKSEFRA